MITPALSNNIGIGVCIRAVSSLVRRLGLLSLPILFALPLQAQTLNYAEGGDPTDDPAATDGVATANRRYVDAVNGNDNNNGQSPTEAWQSIAKVNGNIASLSPGTYVLFKRGQSFTGSLSLGGANGTSGNRIVIGAYGPGHSNGDGDPFNDTRPDITGNTGITGGASWLMIRDLDTGKISTSSSDGGHASDVVIFNNVVHGKAGQNQSNMIRLNDDDARCAIVQNLVYDVDSNDVIALHSAASPTSAVGPSHWIVDNIILGNNGAESGLDLAIAGEATGIINSDFKIIGNRLQMQSGKVPGVTQVYSGRGLRGIEGGHLARHTWVMGNMVTGAARTGIKRSGQVQYIQISGNIVWRCATDDLPLIELASRDTFFEHNTGVFTRLEATRQVLRLNNESGGFAAENTTILRNLFIRTTDGPWFGTLNVALGSIAGMNWNWYGETVAGTVGGLTLANWQSTTGHDLNSSSGDVPGVSVPTTSATDENPKNWYGPTFLDYFTPDSGWGGDSMGDGTPAGALKSDGTWHGGGPSIPGKWNPSQMRAFPSLALNEGYGWEGPLIVQQRYPLPVAILASPSSLTATAISSSQIDLSWTDNSTEETAFRIQRKESVGGTYADTTPATAGANTITLSDTAGLVGDTTYYYQVRAESPTSNSAWSNEASATTPPADTTPPEITTLTATPDHLWPANHQMVAVTLTVTASDDRDPAPVTRILSVTSSEAASGSGDGNTAVDWEITGDLTLNLRAERSGNGPGRLYTVTMQSTDAAGNNSTAAVLIPVGHNNDTKAPTVALIAPVDGSLVAGTAPVTAGATDNHGVIGVQFQLNGVDFGLEDTNAPYGVNWNTATVADGNHTLTAVARDENGNTAASMPVTVTVDNAPPTVALTAPAAGALLTGAGVTVSAAATDNIAVAGVQFLLDGAALGAEFTAAPYEFTWDTTTAAPGAHTLTAVARDGAGNTAVSTIVVSVDNTSPTVAITIPADGATIFGNATLVATASDSSGIAGVQFLVDGVTAGVEDTVAPFEYVWDTLLTTEGTHTVSAIARDLAGLTALSSVVTVSVSHASPPVMVYEAESLTVSANTNTTQIVVDANASEGSYHLLNASGAGSFVTFTVNVATAGTYNVTTGISTRNNRGIFQLKIDGVNQGVPQDYFTPGSATLFGARNLGAKTLSAGAHSFRFECTGKNPSANQFKQGLDYIKLTPQ